MPTIKLTKKSIEGIGAPDQSGKQVLHWDTELKGFGVLCSGTTTAKTYIVQRTLPNGRSRRITIGAVNALDLDGEDGARNRAKMVLSEFFAGKDPKAERRREEAERRKAEHRAITLRAVLENYLESRKELSEATARDYRGSMERYLSDWLDRPLRSITWDLVEERHRDIQAEIEQRRQHRHPAHFGSRPGAAQANLVMVILRALWNFALYRDRDSELPANPVRLKSQWHKEPRRERIVRGDDFPAFYRAISGLSNPIMADYIKLLLFTGLRRTEAAGLRWDEVDFATRVITLGAKRTKADRKLALPMSSFVRDLLVARRAIGDTGWVFPANSKSGHLEEPAFAFDEIAAASGIQVSAHDLRRTFITIAEGTDISPMALKAMVNHSLGNDVTAGYIQMTSERLREPVERVCTRIKELCGIADGQLFGNVSKFNT